jgi:hypothetical protein
MVECVVSYVFVWQLAFNRQTVRGSRFSLLANLHLHSVSRLDVSVDLSLCVWRANFLALPHAGYTHTNCDKLYEAG